MPKSFNPKPEGGFNYGDEVGDTFTFLPTTNDSADQSVITSEQMLAELAKANGAILRWQTSDGHAFELAVVRKIIRFDPDSDCFVHPDAIKVEGGGWRMPTAIELLGDEARPIQTFPEGYERDGKDDWGSERQIDAQNEFTDAVKAIVTPEAWDAYDSYCHKANVDEMVDEGIRIAHVQIAKDNKVRVLYTGDNERPAIMRLDVLISSFNESGGWYARHNATDMRYELDSRGWYEGLHDNGHYLVLNLDKLKLEPHPDFNERNTQ
jgi:hypothetical protein